jgi:hypothetical protein
VEELIKRLEAATEGSRELDKAILLATGWRIDKEAFGIAAASEIWIAPNGDDYDAVVDPFHRFPRPTSSLDSALTLVPEGMCWEISLFPRSETENGPIAFVAKPLDMFTTWTDGATPALALCIASLRARAHQERKDG